jgi:hypothetical protein
MKQRCLNPRNKNYKHYGARGIAIDERWLGKDGFANFLSDMGPRPFGGRCRIVQASNGVRQVSGLGGGNRFRGLELRRGISERCLEWQNKPPVHAHDAQTHCAQWREIDIASASAAERGSNLGVVRREVSNKSWLHPPITLRRRYWPLWHLAGHHTGLSADPSSCLSALEKGWYRVHRREWRRPWREA